PWPEMPYFSRLCEHFTVVLASPRGYQRSSRLTGDQLYDATTIVRDLLTVCDAVGLRRFSVLGYSLTAAMAAWLARSTLRVDAVVAGGFPLLGSYEAVRRGAERDAAGLTAGDAQAASLLEQFDSRAVLSFYRALAELPDGVLV